MFGKMKNSVASRISPTREHLSALRTDLRQRLRGFKSAREQALQKELEDDFARVLEAWGIGDEADLPGILRDMRLRCLILAAPVCVAVLTALLSRNLMSFLTLVIVAPPCLVGIAVTRWRMVVLRNRVFLSFPRWLLSGFFRNHP
jgi:hypothetical protein